MPGRWLADRLLLGALLLVLGTILRWALGL
jgi:hypothetical protein